MTIPEVLGGVKTGKTLTGNEVTETSVSVQLYRYPKGGTRDLTNPVGEPITLTSAKIGRMSTSRSTPVTTTSFRSLAPASSTT